MDTEEDGLIAEAQLWATGATIHDVKSLIGDYRAFTECANRPGETPKRIEWAEFHARLTVKRLREFMAHGDYKRAMRENPPPGGWTRNTYG